jgi:hypothetical protein
MIFDELFSQIYGMFCWDAEKGYGSFLTFEFGEPHLDIWDRYRSKDGIREKIRGVAIHGDWHLWIYVCDWEIYWHDTLKANSQSASQDIIRAMGRLNGQCLTHVEVHPSCATTFVFELGDRLETMPNVTIYGQDSEQWLLYEHSGKVFTLRADQMYSYKPGNTPKNDESWHPLIFS